MYLMTPFIFENSKEINPAPQTHSDVSFLRVENNLNELFGVNIGTFQL